MKVSPNHKNKNCGEMNTMLFDFDNEYKLIANLRRGHSKTICHQGKKTTSIIIYINKTFHLFLLYNKLIFTFHEYGLLILILYLQVFSKICNPISKVATDTRDTGDFSWIVQYAKRITGESSSF